MELNDQFSSDFRTLNRDGTKEGPEPLKWQIRLFEQLCANDVPKVCDLPTGMGKTSIIHLWMLALRHQIFEKKPRLPTRLVYVVDRRTVVDQATDIAERIQGNLPSWVYRNTGFPLVHFGANSQTIANGLPIPHGLRS